MNKVRAITRILRRTYSNGVNVGVKEDFNIIQDNGDLTNFEEHDSQKQSQVNVINHQNSDAITVKKVPVTNKKKLLTFNEFTKNKLHQIYKEGPTEKAVTLLHEYKKYVEAEKVQKQTDEKRC